MSAVTGGAGAAGMVDGRLAHADPPADSPTKMASWMQDLRCARISKQFSAYLDTVLAILAELCAHKWRVEAELDIAHRQRSKAI